MAREGYTNEDIIERLSKYTSVTELRKEDLNLYNLGLKRGLLDNLRTKDARRTSKNPWIEEELIEWIKMFSRRMDLRNDSQAKYLACIRMGLQEHFPKRTTKYGNIVGEGPTAKMKEDREIRRLERLKRKSEGSLNKKDKDVPDSRRKIFKGEFLENGNTRCGRCLEEKEPELIGKRNRQLCRKCYLKIQTLEKSNKDTNLWNIRDEFCNVRIRHYDKVFEIGIRVDEHTEWYLTTIGYSMLFKDVYEE